VRKIDKIYLDILSRLKNPKTKIEWKWLQGCEGEVEEAGNDKFDKIFITPGLIIRVLIHEALHLEFPEWSEEQVLYYERKLMSRLILRRRNALFQEAWKKIKVFGGAGRTRSMM